MILREKKKKGNICFAYFLSTPYTFFFFPPWYLFYSLVETLGSYRIEAACYTWKMRGNMHSFVLILFATKDRNHLLVSLHFTEIRSLSYSNSSLSCCNEGQELSASKKNQKNHSTCRTFLSMVDAKLIFCTSGFYFLII